MKKEKLPTEEKKEQKQQKQQKKSWNEFIRRMKSKGALLESK